MNAPNGLDPDDSIREEVRRAVGQTTIFIAGSRATGDATEDSDYDVVVVLSALHIPFAMPRLRRAQLALEERLCADVCVNPMPPVVLSHPERNLFVWKMLREPRVIAARDGFSVSPPGRPPVSDEISFSYLLSAVLYLIDPLDPTMLAGQRLPRAVSAGVRKALLHVAQLRLFRSGRSAVRLEEAIDLLQDDTLARISQEPARPPAWLACRSAVIAELGPRPPRLATSRAAARNAQYAVLASMRGTPRWRAAASLRAVDRRLSVLAVRLLSAVRPGGDVDPLGIAAARRALPAGLGAEAPQTWHGLRDLVSREWINAHPVMGV
jgi:predicted nucleotidyltransferase